MKAFFTSMLFLSLTFVSAYGQLGGKLGKTPAISTDWRPGYVNITELNGGLGLSITDVPFAKNYFGITTVNGYQFTRNAKGGVGVGLQFHNGGMLIPLYLDGRFSFNAQMIVPFLSVAAGAALSPENINDQSRVFVNPSVGVKFIARQRLGVTFSAGLMTQGGGTERRSSFICFKLGTEFKGKKGR